MSNYKEILAAGILGVSIIVAAMIVNSGLQSSADRIRSGLAFPPPPNIPDTITVRSGNSTFNVQVDPMKVDVHSENKQGK
jgi:hypothetical protein